MRSTVWMTILLAGSLTGTLVAEWRHFGDGDPVTVSMSKESVPHESMPHEMVEAHNAVRARVGTEPLRWSGTLARVAQEWADGLMRSGQFVHSHNPKYGENLYEITGASASPFQVINAFASEVKDYDYKTNSCRGVCGHYTQLVWNSTKEVGCAVARGGRREVWVCEYDPPGNWVGRKPY